LQIEAYLNLNFDGNKLHALPGEKEDTLTRLQRKLKQCSPIPGLVEIHIVFGPLGGIAKARTNTIEELTNVVNEIGKIFPIKGCMTYIVQPQLHPGETTNDSNFN